MITILSIIFFISIIGLFAGLETGSYTINKLKLQHKALNNDKEANILIKNLSDPQIFIFTTLIIQNFFVYIVSMLMTNFLLKNCIGGDKIIFAFNFIPWSAEVAATLLLMFPMFIFGEVGPKNLFRVNTDTLMYKFANLQYICILLCKPFTLPLKYLSGILNPKHNEALVNELKNLTLQKMSFFFTEGEKSGVITKHQNNMLINAINLKEINAKNIMIPICDTVSFSINTHPDIIYTSMKKYKYDLIPIYSEGNKNNIIGIISVFDLIKIRKERLNTVKSYISEIISVKKQMNIQEIYYELHNFHKITALVKNKQNCTVGIIWLKDIIRYMSKEYITSK
ncbi:MAG TPA: CNNM domain-containing protein [Victivallales bacterium]|nr:CNNM domain-containing protein [Victivallales bacterium]